MIVLDSLYINNKIFNEENRPATFLVENNYLNATNFGSAALLRGGFMGDPDTDPNATVGDPRSGPAGLTFQIWLPFEASSASTSPTPLVT